MRSFWKTVILSVEFFERYGMIYSKRVCDKSMEESIFENKYTLNKKIARDLILRVSFGNFRKVAYVFCAIGVWTCIVGLLGVIVGSPVLNMPPAYAIYGFIYVVPFMLMQIRKYSAARQLMRRWQLLTAASNKNDSKTIFFEDAFEADDLKFKYDQISKLAETKLCVYIVLEKAATVIVQKDAFIKGDYSEFVIFLRKRVKSKLKTMIGIKRF